MDILMHSDGTAELYHYGVIGMKWGVRNNRSRAIQKSYDKLGKLDRSVERPLSRH